MRVRGPHLSSVHTVTRYASGRTAFSSRVTHAVPSRVRRIIINIYSRTHRASPRASPGPFATCVDPSMTRESLILGLLAFARASHVDLPMKRRRLEAPAGACLAERALKRNGIVYKNFGRFRAGACAGPPLADGFAGDAALAGRSSW